MRTYMAFNLGSPSTLKNPIFWAVMLFTLVLNLCVILPWNILSYFLDVYKDSKYKSETDHHDNR